MILLTCVFYQVPKTCSFHAIKNWPHILGCSVNKLKLMVEQLTEMGITNKKLGQVIATSPQLLLRKPQEFVQVGSEGIRLNLKSRSALSGQMV